MKPYGTIELTVTSPAQSFTEPLGLTEAKQNLREYASLTHEDDTIEAFIAAARELAEVLQGRDLVVKQWDYHLDGFPPCEIQLRTPLRSVEVVSYTDEDGTETVLTAGTDYVVDLHRGVVLPAPDTAWPSFVAWPSSAVLIRYTSGYAATDAFWGDAGKRIIQGMKLLISDWHDNRVPQSDNPNDLPMAVKALLGWGGRPLVY